jgi:hypothetical protein
MLLAAEAARDRSGGGQWTRQGATAAVSLETTIPEERKAV